MDNLYNSSFVENLAIFLENALSQKNLNIQLIYQGWFPSTITLRYKKNSTESIDEFMIRCLTGRYYEQIKADYFYKSYPHRYAIYKEAFTLYEEGRYLASIPLFINQLDGIIMEYGSAGIFLGKNKIENNVKKEQLKFFEYLKLHASTASSISLIKYYENIFHLGSSLSISKGTTQILNPNDIDHLNRHGIIHGQKDFLNYGTKINTLKVISLTLFIINNIQRLKLANSKSY